MAPEAAAPAEKTEVKKQPKKKDTKVSPRAGFACYVGPSIVGAVQKNQIFPGTVDDAKEALAAVIKKKPVIARLIVDGADLAEALGAVRQSGTLLHDLAKKAGK